MKAVRCTPTVLAVLGVAAGAGLLSTAMTPAVVATTLSQPARAAQLAGPESVAVAAAAGACWVALIWLTLALALTTASQVPGGCGRLCAALATRTVPVAVRRLLAFGLGAAVVTATAGPALAGASPGMRPLSAAAAGVAAAPDLDWPVASSVGRSAAPSGRSAPAGNRPPVRAAPATRPETPSVVVVRSGDSLWGLALAHLHTGAHRSLPIASNAEVAAAWPRWYAANRALIGPAPDRLIPGQRLVAPPEIPGGSS